jgi:hypothetical protein
MTWDEVTTQYATQSLLAMAAGMTIPMVAWMVYRGMGWKNAFEMAAAMIVPVIPFLCLVWFGVTKSAQCGAYCAFDGGGHARLDARTPQRLLNGDVAKSRGTQQS